MRNRYLYFLRLTLVITDFLSLNAAFLIAYNLTDDYHIGRGADNWKYPYFMINLMWVVSTNVSKLYQFDPLNSYKRVIKATVQSAFFQLLIFVLYINFMGIGTNTYLLKFLFIFSLQLVVTLLLSRAVFTRAEPFIKKLLGPKKAISLLEMSPSASFLAPYLNSNAMHHRFEVFDFHKNNEKPLMGNAETLPYQHLFKNAVDKGLDELYISLSPDEMKDTITLQKEADRHGLRLRFIYNFEKQLQIPLQTNYIGNIPVLSLRKEPLEDINNVIIKRLFDIAFSVLIVILVLSWLYPILALLITLESKGPVLFKQVRTGLSGEEFICYKFRSMKVNKLGDIKQASKQDDRKTRIGIFLRKTSLDELPQFWNVLLGNMSVVGPRPHMLKHTEEYRNLIDNYMVRHYSKPGITGWAQVNGFRGETHTLYLMEQRVEHDIWYIENWSTKLDLEIICRTCAHVFKGDKNAY